MNRADVERIADWCRQRWHQLPRIGIVLGSGLSTVCSGFTLLDALPYNAMPGMPCTTAPGHHGVWYLAEYHKSQLHLLSGRFHRYEGYTPQQVALPIRLLGCLGVHIVVLTSAVGGLHPFQRPGEIAVIADHINLQGTSVLEKSAELGWSDGFVDMAQAYDPALRRLALSTADQCGEKLREVVYAAMLGPQYETPAEYRMLKTMGADVVGMSVVPEVLAARQLGMRVLGLVVITNVFQQSSAPTNAQSVLACASNVANRLTSIIHRLLPHLELAAEEQSTNI